MDNNDEVADKLLSTGADTLASTRAMDQDAPEFDDIYLDNDPELDTTLPGCLTVSWLATLVNCACFPFSMLACCGFVAIPERTHGAVLYFGKYVGSVQEPGIHILPPLGVEWRWLSTATRTMSMEDIKVLDSRGNPVIISAVVTFEPTSARKACIDVENPWPEPGRNASGSFLQLQAKAVLKQVTSMFPYEAPKGEPSLQTEGAHIAEMLISRLQRRVSISGARIMSFDLVDLSYAPEIASAMLVRQQASALVDARKLIVQAAVDMTHQAVHDLEAKTGRPLSEEMRERTCANLLTVICASESVTPTLNVGR